MSDAIFASEAKKYYDAGLQVIPLRPKSKRPQLYKWNHLAKQAVEVEQQDKWIRDYGRGNIGLVLGESSDLCAIDIDSEDQKIVDIILSVLPTSPWKRVGRKGMMLAYRRNPNLKNVNIAEAKNPAVPGSGGMIVEILCNARQMVLPPSIHPDTMEPYVSNTNLYDKSVLDGLCMLPDDIEDKLREALGEHVSLGNRSGAGFKPLEYISAGNRDNTMISLAGTMAIDVRLGRVSVREAIDYMLDWAERNIENVVGDELDINKGIRAFSNWLISDVEDKNRVLPIGWDVGLSDKEKEDLNLMFSEEHEEWTETQMLEHLQAEFGKFQEESDGRRKAIDFILRKIAKSGTGKIEIERVLRYIVKYNKDGVTVAVYKQQIKEYQQGSIAGNDHTEIAMSAIDYFESRNGLIRSWKKGLWTWAGDHWKVVDEEKLKGMLAREYGNLPAARRASDFKGIIEVMVSILEEKGFSESGRGRGVNFANGFVTTDLKINKHSPEQGMTYVLPYRYDPESAGNFPMFSQLLATYWGQDDDYADKVSALQEAMCSTIFGLGPSYQKCFILYGPGQTGKSQLLEIISNLVPEEARCNIKPDKWREDFALVSLDQKLLNIVGEIDVKRKITGDIFKEVVTGDPLSARRLFKDYYSFRCQATHWFASNHFPRSDDTSEGFFRRWYYLNFTRVVPQSERVLDIGKIIVAKEMEAIISWAMEAYDRLVENNGYTECASHLDLLQEMGAQNSSVRYFFGSCPAVKYGSGLKVKRSDMYKHYWAFVIGSGMSAVSEKRFILEVSSMKKDFEIEGDLYKGVAYNEKK